MIQNYATNKIKSLKAFSFLTMSFNMKLNNVINFWRQLIFLLNDLIVL